MLNEDLIDEKELEVLKLRIKLKKIRAKEETWIEEKRKLLNEIEHLNNEIKFWKEVILNDEPDNKIQSLLDKITSLKKENCKLAQKLHFVNNFSKYEEYFTNDKFDFVRENMELVSSINAFKNSEKQLKGKIKSLKQENEKLIKERSEILSQLVVYKTTNS